MNLSFFSSLCFLFLFFLLSSSEADLDSEFLALLEFKKGIAIDPSGQVSGTWDAADRPYSTYFAGITRDTSTGSVVSIDLSGLGLSGNIKFNTLTPLRSLQNLSLGGNAFVGRIPPTLGSISSLRYLDLSSNQFVGTLPGRFTELYGLNYLNLSNNKFEGGIPFGFRNLQQLRVLDLHRNDFFGDVGEFFSELRNVEHVDLSCNRFYGGLSVPLENISSLANTVRFLNLSQNSLNGGFLKEGAIGLFRNLQVMDLGDNGISGELPAFGSLPTLWVLRLGNNQLYGRIPAELLEGGVPLKELDLSRNGFTGSVNVINSTSLEILDLSSNGLSGNFPNLSLGLQAIITFSLRNNSLTGTVPPLLGTYPVLSVVDLSLNQLGGPIPSSLFTSKALKNLNLSGNRFDGPFPLHGSRVSELIAMRPDSPLESLDLSSNTLGGGLPSEIGNMARLQLLNLANNHFSGQLPSELNKLTNLQHLDLSGNQFKGSIPDQLPSNLKEFNVSYNDLSGTVPDYLRKFPKSSFYPGNSLLVLPRGSENSDPKHPIPISEARHSSRGSVRVAIIVVASVGAAVMIGFVLFVYHRARLRVFHGRSGFSETAGADVKMGRFSRPSLFNFQSSAPPRQTSLSFSNDHLLTTNSRSLSGQQEFATEIVEHAKPVKVITGSTSTIPNLLDDQPLPSERKSSPGSPLPSSPRFIEACEQPVTLEMYSPERLAGDLYFLDSSVPVSIEELSRAPAEVLGRSSHGTLYKATLRNGHMLSVKWLRVGLVKHKKEFAREVKKIGSIRHPNFVPLRAYYWGPREQERLLLADYIQCDSLALHLYETTPRRYSPLVFSQRLKVAIEVAQCLLYLHDRGLPHGSLKPTNILLAGPEYHACLTDYCLHRLMTPAGIAEQILNLGALGYRAPELASASKPAPSFKADVYAFGVILMELLTRRSAGDIISGQSGAVDLTDWVRLCDQEGRAMDCIDRDMASGEEHSRSMDDLLAVSLRCILPVHERPNIRQVLDDLSSISA